MRWTSQMVAAHNKKMGMPDVEVVKVSKYRNNTLVVDGVRFDSKKELCRWNDLKFLQSIGEISELKRQVVYQLSVCRYIADHEYKDRNGVVIVEDVKSVYTRKMPVYRLKKKMMLAEKGIAIKEV